jgi:hypothetical protein
MSYAVLPCTLPAGTGSRTFTGLSFLPTAIMFVSSWIDTDNGSALSFHESIGYADGTRQRCIAGSNGGGGSGGPKGQILMNTKCLVCCDASGADARVQASLTSFNSNGFTLNVTHNDLTNFRFQAYCWNNVDAYTDDFALTVQASPPVNQSITAPGLRPDIVLFSYGNENSSLNNTRSTAIGQVNGLGWMCRDGTQGAIGFAINNGGVAGGYISAARCIVISNGNSVLSNQCSFSAMLSNGFRITLQTNTDDCPIIYLALKGRGNELRATAAQFNQPVAPGQVSITGKSFQPNGVIIASDNVAGANNYRYGIGSSDGVNEAAQGGAYVFFANASKTNVVGKVFRVVSNAPATLAEADLLSFNPDGLTLDYTTADAVARPTNALMFATSGAEPIPFLPAVPGVVIGVPILLVAGTEYGLPTRACYIYWNGTQPEKSNDKVTWVPIVQGSINAGEFIRSTASDTYVKLAVVGV